MPSYEAVRVVRYVHDKPQPHGSEEYAPPSSWGPGWEFVGMTMTSIEDGRMEVLIAWKRSKNGKGV